MRYGRTSASLISGFCFLRELPLFFGATPKTPLRVLCLIALDTLHVLRTSKPLSRDKIKVLSMFLDFAACTNAVLDHKKFRRDEYRMTRQWLDRAGLATWVNIYLRRLREIEDRRPAPGGDRKRFEEVRAYREAVVRLSLETLAAIALGAESAQDSPALAPWRSDLEVLFRIVMQCQIIDDVLDYAEDAAADLPGFLTASASLPKAFAMTADAARGYAAWSDEPRLASRFPFRLALFAVSALTSLLIHSYGWQCQRSCRTKSPAKQAPSRPAVLALRRHR